MFVETNHTQEQKKQKVCDWNHLLLSVTVPATPTSRRDRHSELTQPRFFDTDENVWAWRSECYENNVCSHRLVHSISLASDVDFGENIVSVLGSYDNFLTVIHFSFSPSFVTMSSSKPIGVRRMNRRNLAQRLEDHCYEALAFSRHNIDLVFDEEKTATRKTHEGARKCRYWSKFHERK